MSTVKTKTDCLILSGDIFSLGGIQTYTRHLLSAMEEKFADRHFITLVLNDNPGDEFKKWPNIRTIFCGQLKNGLIRKIFFALRALKIALVRKPGLLLCCHVHIAVLALWIQRFTGINYVVVAYGSDVWDLKNGIRFQALANARFILSLSNYTKEQMLKNGIKSEKIRVVNPAVDTGLFLPLAVNMRLSKQLALEDKKMLLLISRIDSRERQKGHDIMLEVMRLLDDNFVLVVFGNGDDVGRLTRIARELGVLGKVRFQPAHSVMDTLDYYNLCDVFVMPSKQEGFGIVYLEALACGKPVVAGSKDASKEALLNGKLGFLVNPDSPQEIVQAIQAACEKQDPRTNPEYLRKEVEANFGIRIFNNRIKEAFSECL